MARSTRWRVPNRKTSELPLRVVERGANCPMSRLNSEKATRRVYLNRSTISWALYDWANSTFSTSVMVGFFPLFFNQYWSVDASGAQTVFQIVVGGTMQVTMHGAEFFLGLQIQQLVVEHVPRLNVFVGPIPSRRN